VSPENKVTYTPDDATFTLTNPTREGYTFDGWTGTDITSAQKTVSIASGSIGDKSYTANWTPNTYGVTLNKNGGTITGDELTSYTYGVGATLPTAITKTGHTFGGWYEDIGCTGSDVTVITTTDIGTKTYYAQWTPNEYSVTLDPNGGTITTGDVKTYTYGVGATLPTDVTRKGYSFDGWYADSTLSGSAIASISATDIENKSFVAKWTENQATITYVGQAGGTVKLKGGAATASSVSETIGVVTGTPKGAVAVPNDGYYFCGWYSDAECNTAAGSSTEFAPTKNTDDLYETATYYASFAEKMKVSFTLTKLSAQYKIKESDSYADTGDTVKLEINSPLIVKLTPDPGCLMPTEITVTGATYTFDATTGVITFTSIASDVSITAKAIEKVDASAGTKELKSSFTDTPNTVSVSLADLTVDSVPLTADQKKLFIEKPLYITSVTVGDVTLDSKDSVLEGKRTWGSEHTNDTFAITAEVASVIDLSNVGSGEVTSSFAADDAIVFTLYNANAITDITTARTVTVKLATQTGADMTTASTITLELSLKREAASINVTVPLVMVVKTNIDGGSVTPDESTYAIQNDSDTRIQLTKIDVTDQPTGSPLSRVTAAGALPRDSYRINLLDMSNPHNIKWSGKLNPIISVEVGRLSFVTKDSQDEKKYGVLFSNLEYTLVIPTED